MQKTSEINKLYEMILADDEISSFLLSYKIHKNDIENVGVRVLLINADAIKTDFILNENKKKELINELKAELNYEFIIKTITDLSELRDYPRKEFFKVIRYLLEKQADNNTPKPIKDKIKRDFTEWFSKTKKDTTGKSGNTFEDYKAMINFNLKAIYVITYIDKAILDNSIIKADFNNDDINIIFESIKNYCKYYKNKIEMLYGYYSEIVSYTVETLKEAKLDFELSNNSNKKIDELFEIISKSNKRDANDIVDFIFSKLVVNNKQEKVFKYNIIKKETRTAKCDRVLITADPFTKITGMHETLGKRPIIPLDKINVKIKSFEKKDNLTDAERQELENLYNELAQEKKRVAELTEQYNNNKADINLLESLTKEETNYAKLKTKRRKINELEAKNKIIEKEIGYINGAQCIEDENGIIEITQISNDNKKQIIRYKNEIDLEKFNITGRRFIEYIPNIPNIAQQIKDQNGIVIFTLKGFCDYWGYSKPRNVKDTLFNNMQIIKHESYIIEYKDITTNELLKSDFSIIADISMDMIGNDIAFKVQLGHRYYEDLLFFLKNGYYVKIDEHIYNIETSKKKNETRSALLYKNIARLARINRKNGLSFTHTFKIKTLIDILESLGELNYDTNRYSQMVVAPLLEALNTGVELDIFKEYKTEAFNNYDNAIATGTNGANNSHKKSDFENSSITITLNELYAEIKPIEKHISRRSTKK